MAQEDDALIQDEDKRKRQFGQDPSRARDPLFYEGKTPVLGQDVSVEEPTGELTFPEAGAAAPPPVGPGAAPTPNPYPPFPEFNLEMPEFNFNPSQGPMPPDLQLPQAPDVPWWSQALTIGSKAADEAMKAKEAYDISQSLGAPPAWTGPNPNLFSLTGAAPEEWFAGSEGMFNLTGESLPATDAAYTLGGDTNLYTNLAGDVAPTTPFSSVGSSVLPALAALGVGAGAYGAATAEPGSPEQITGGMTAVGGGLTLASQLGMLGPAWGAAGPYAAALALPMVIGKLYEAYGPPSADKIRTPPGWTYVPATGNDRGVGGYVVDPATGRVVQYTGGGRYIPFGIMSPEQFQQYGIEPTGALAQRPEYSGIAKAIRDVDIAKAGQPVSAGSQTPGYPTEAHQRSYLEEWRQPYIDQLKAQYPMADEGELWRLYTQSPWYQQELLMVQSWNPDAALMNRG